MDKCVPDMTHKIVITAKKKKKKIKFFKDAIVSDKWLLEHLTEYNNTNLTKIYLLTGIRGVWNNCLLRSPNKALALLWLTGLP